MYYLYGKRGIKVCDEWKDSFLNFYNDMGEPVKGMQLDRINNDEDYSKDNCRWVSAKENCNNKRNNRNVTFNNKTQSITQWSREIGISDKILRQRIDRDGWSIEKAFTHKG